MRYYVQKIRLVDGREKLLIFAFFSDTFDLHGAMFNAVSDHIGEAEASKMDYVDLMLSIEEVPEALCTKYGFSLVNHNMRYSYIRVQN